MLCAVTFAAARPKPETLHVLFIGNSYTYFNDLPEIFARLGEAGGHGKVQTKMEAPGGWRLKDHWEKGGGPRLLGEEKWDYVVLQDQSTLGMDYWVEGKDHVNSDVLFRPYAEKWAAAIRQAGGTPVFFLTWAAKGAPEDQAALTYAYTRAAKETGSLLAPVGMAWEAVRREKLDVGLFSEGHGSHPSPSGSYLAACVLYAAVFHQSPVGLPSKVVGTPVNLDTELAEVGKSAALVDLMPEDADILQREAWSTWQNIARTGGYPSISQPDPPIVPPLTAGLPITDRDLEGTWQGTILFYPVGPVEMTLRVHNPPGAKPRLEIKYHSKDFTDESIELSDFAIKGRTIVFRDPKSVGVDNLEVRLTGIMTKAGELRGRADAARVKPDGTVTLSGSWSLKKVRPGQ